MGKSTQQPLAKSTERSPRVHHRYHLDLGFASGRCFQLVLDDYTRETFLLILDEGKGEAFDSWKQLKERLDRRHWPLRVAFVRTDMEPLYVSAKWDKHCEEEGIEREYSSRYRHDQN